MGRGTLFIQPHSDDMVMSSYFLIRAGVWPRPYSLLTVFSGSGWVDPIKRRRFCSANPVEVTKLRMKEDKRFARLFRMRMCFFNFEDCLFRNQKTYFDPKIRLEKTLVSKVSKSIFSFIKRRGIGNVVIPFPSGRKQHYDHRIVCEAVRHIEQPVQIYFVDDLPYGRVVNPEASGLGILIKVPAGGLLDKFRAMRLYDSQMCDLFFDQVRKIARQNGGFERAFKLEKYK